MAGAGAIGGAAIASSGANKAADTQAQGADYAATLQKQSADEALALQKQQYDTQQQEIQPWLKSGTTAINQLAGETVPSFQAPTNVTEQNDPGFQFRLQQGQKALEQSAAARGSVLSGATAKAINDYAQGSASSEYGNVYNRAMNEYNTNVLGPYNRLSSLAGVGQQAQASSAQQGQGTANAITNIALTSGQQQGNAVQQAAAARASGYASNANIWGSTIGGIGNNISQQMLLSQLNGRTSYGLGPGQIYAEG